MMKKIVDWIVSSGTEFTYNGSFIVDAVDLIENLGVSSTWLSEHHNELTAELEQRKEVAEVDDRFAGKEWIGFDIVFYLDHCPNAEPAEEFDYD